MQPTVPVTTGEGYDFLKDYQNYFSYSLSTLDENNWDSNNNNNNSLVRNKQQKQQKQRSIKRRRQRRHHNRQQPDTEHGLHPQHYHQHSKHYQQHQQQLQPDFQLLETLSTMQLQHHLSIQQQELIQQLQLVQRQYLIHKGFVQPLQLDFQTQIQRENSPIVASASQQLHQHVHKQNDQQQQQYDIRQPKSTDKNAEQFQYSPQQHQQQSQHFEQTQFEQKHISNKQYQQHKIKEDNNRTRQKNRAEEPDEDCADEDFNLLPSSNEDQKRAVSIDSNNMLHMNELQCSYNVINNNSNKNNNNNTNNNNESISNENPCNDESKSSCVSNSNAAEATSSTSPTRKETEQPHQQLDVSYNNSDGSSSNKDLTDECKQQQPEPLSTAAYSNMHQAQFSPLSKQLHSNAAVLKIEDADDEDDDMEDSISRTAPDEGENIAFLTMQQHQNRGSPLPQHHQHVLDMYHQQDHVLPPGSHVGLQQPSSLPLKNSTFATHAHTHHTAAVAVAAAAAMNSAVVAAAAAGSSSNFNNILDIIGGASGLGSDGDIRAPPGAHHLESFNAKKYYHPLYAHGVCRWPSCELALDDVAAFVKDEDR